MAVATAAGMFSSMVLTLLIVPVFYIVLESIRVWMRTPRDQRRARLRSAEA